MKLAFLSMDDLDGYVADDELAFEPLRELGWQVETVSWRKARLDWKQYAAVIIRTTWDYQKDLPAFLLTLKRIESETRLANSVAVAEWNADKTYLRELEKNGAKIVPTIWDNGSIANAQIALWRERLQTDEIVIKPTVSANADDTFRLQGLSAPVPELNEVFRNRSFLVQPFMSGIVEEGEFSLFYLNGEYSHAILKTPATGDFRVQEEHGGLIQAVQPTAKLLAAGQSVMQLIHPTPLYARADFVRDEANDFLLMELELIEPSLYLRMDGRAPRRFARAINDWLAPLKPPAQG